MSYGSRKASYRAGNSSTVYYGIPTLFILFSLWLAGHGVVTWFRAEPHPAYFASPACDEKWLLDGQEHLAKPCAVLNAEVVSQDDGGALSLNIADAKQLSARDPKIPSFYNATIPGWGADHKQLRVQVYEEAGNYVVAKAYDIADKRVQLAKERPMSKGETGWGEIRIAFIILGICAVWIFLGRFMRFSDSTD